MTTSALITMISSWLVIIYFALRFFRKVLNTPQEKQ